MRTATRCATVLTICLLLHACSKGHDTDKRDLTQIRDSKELVVLTMNSSTSYFIYRGQEMGFQYELSKLLADSLGVRLKIVVANSVTEMVERLMSGEGDLIAYNVPFRRIWKAKLTYCGDERITRQVVVQRKGRQAVLDDVTQLCGKDIYVKSGKYFHRLNNLNEELGGCLHIHHVTDEGTSDEDLITQVAQGKIDYTVVDNDIAQLNRTYYPNLDIHLAVGLEQRSSWVVRKESPQLAEFVNSWHEANVTQPSFTARIKRYFEISKAMPHSPILSLREGKISHYDKLFKKYAKDIDWDWRLLASLAYTESNFDTTAVSWAGASGLMQLMPVTAHRMGVPVGMERNPEESIRAATNYIAYMKDVFRKVPESELTYFILASYNSGIGHIQDAMALAEKYGKDKYTWKDNVETYLLLKSNEEYFTDSVCKNGYFRGNESINLVNETLQRYEVYKEKIRK